MTSIDWHKVTTENEIPKDCRLLLIGKSMNLPADALEMDIYDLVVGHWNKFVEAFVPVELPGQGGLPGKLRVTHWASIPTPAGVKLRVIEELR
jgi:hypothetical protein